ncbi:hypothetical protein DXV76_01000 [Rhodobacteraceae bacterium CCMM004]|nr:hypothetical protein DXV76_01000 [Rhodobacteraceae bacterium CCMM004]
MTFSEIEKIIAGRLPASARKHRAWWSNNPSNSVITHAWLGAGYRTAQVNLEGERVTFVRSDDRPGGDPSAPPRHPLHGSLAGTVSVAEGTDLTEPLGAAWDAEGT